MMFWTRSAGIVDWVWLTEIVLPGLITLPERPGSQSRKYSPISDCGRDRQNASEWNWPKPFLLTCTVTWAWHAPELPLMHADGRSIDLIVPAITPATLKSDPLTSPKALSSWIL